MKKLGLNYLLPSQALQALGISQTLKIYEICMTNSEQEPKNQHYNFTN